mmetsp:Transcript_102747/g.257659  ORF Transcript_102747/g.257659 Transcript_102747/m.257659 type:complete len:232 (-) Transcript_102747:131-826(-)|eukprot:CAMPEP_0115307176 /NCGR_PEP_ID=MMETSP0270-20121206/72992_1 /TAXON_ID=71861 /ORGANISM="Scrippsiella trochoidea, Strain CCMP3099" /LENGTH=231 /DNA_ID=CAMNT_0002725583 /DNA_START=60 /DNA_END=755 /DNA_ORIENTATION=-
MRSFSVSRLPFVQQCQVQDVDDLLRPPCRQEGVPRQAGQHQVGDLAELPLGDPYRARGRVHAAVQVPQDVGLEVGCGPVLERRAVQNWALQDPPAQILCHSCKLLSLQVVQNRRPPRGGVLQHCVADGDPKVARRLRAQQLQPPHGLTDGLIADLRRLLLRGAFSARTLRVVVTVGQRRLHVLHQSGEMGICHKEAGVRVLHLATDVLPVRAVQVGVEDGGRVHEVHVAQD